LSDPFKQAAGNRKVLTADESAEGRLDAWLTAQVGEEFSRSRIKTLIKDGQVFLRGQPVTDPQRKVRTGDSFEITLPEPEDPTPQGEDIPLDILHEDDDVIVISKPSGLVVHPGPGNWTGTLVNALIHHCSDTLSGIGGVRRPGIVHRLDKDTTGVMVVAKNDIAHRHLSLQFADHGRTMPLERAYQAIVWGRPRSLTGTVNAPLGRDTGDRTRRAVKRPGTQDADEAITPYEVLERFHEKPDATSPGSGKRPCAPTTEASAESWRTIAPHAAGCRRPLARAYQIRVSCHPARSGACAATGSDERPAL